MRYKVIGCEVLARMMYLSAAQSPHVIDMETIRYGLHQRPDELRSLLQAAIDKSSGKGYDAILLAYGLCGKSTNGLTARDLPIIIPRAHDCITLFLGGRERYRQEFEQTPGTYWYVQDYIERDDGTGASLSAGATLDEDWQAQYAKYVDKFGKDNADYLMETMGAWQSHYQRAALIDLGVGDPSKVAEKARRDAERRGWAFERVAGDLVLIRRLIFGDWNEDYLVLQPGQSIAMSMDDNVICAA